MTRKNYLFKYQQLLFVFLAMILSFGVQAQCAPGAITLIYEDFEDCVKPVGWSFENTGTGTAAWEYNASTVNISGSPVSPNGTCWARFDDSPAAALNTGTVMSPIFNPSGLDDVVLSFKYAFNDRGTNPNDAVYLWIEDIDTGSRQYKKSTSGYQETETPWLADADAEGTITNFLSALLPADFMSGPIRIGIEFTDDNGQANQFAFDDFSLCGMEKECEVGDVIVIDEDFEDGILDPSIEFSSGWDTFTGNIIGPTSVGMPQGGFWATHYDASSGNNQSRTMNINITGSQVYSLSFFYEYDDNGTNPSDRLLLRVRNLTVGGNDLFWDGVGWGTNSTPWLEEDRIGFFDEEVPQFFYSEDDELEISLTYSDGTGTGHGVGVDDIRVCGTPPCVLDVASVTTFETPDCNSDGAMIVTLNPPFTNSGTYTVTLIGGPAYSGTGVIFNSTGEIQINDVPVGTYTGVQVEIDSCIGSLTTGLAIEEAQPFTSLVLDVSNPTCNSNNGSITAIPTSTAGNDFTYEWSLSLATSETLSGLSDGSRTVTVTDVTSGCTTTGSATSVRKGTTVSNVAIQASSLDNIAGCNDSGSATVTFNDQGSSTTSIQWNDMDTQTTQTAIGLEAGIHTVIVSTMDDSLCTASTTVEIFEGTPVVITGITVDNVSCNGTNDGSIMATTSGGNGNLTYIWAGGSNPPNSNTFNNLSAGNYSLTVTDEKACTDVISNMVVTGSGLLNFTGLPDTLACNGDANGVLDITPTGGTAPYTFNWSNGATTEDISGLIAGIYRVTITDANGCVKNTQNARAVREPDEITGTATITNINCFGDSNGAITVTANGGTPGYTYLWFDNITSPSRTGLAAGSYSLSITDANDCTIEITSTITQPALLSALTNPIDLVSCFGLSDGSIAASGTGGTTPYSYQWSTGQTTSTITNIPAGSYTATITDASGCSSTSAIVLGEATPLTVTGQAVNNPLCFGDSNGSIDISVDNGSGNFSFSWTANNGTPPASTEDITNLAAGKYTVEVTDNSSGCTTMEVFFITEPAPITFMGQPDTLACFGDANGILDITPLGGTSPYSFKWSNGETTEDISGLTVGNYSVTITDANGCVKNTQNIRAVRQPPAFTASSTSTNLACFGDSDGTISISAGGGTPGYNYEWSDNGSINTPDRTGLTAGTYTVSITDANDCLLEETVNLLQPPPLTVTALETQSASCAGVSDGSASATGTGGTGAYTYTWSTGNTTPIVSGITSGTYSITITDQNGCFSTASVTVGEDTPISINNQSINDLACFGDLNGSIDISISNGSGSFSFNWSDEFGTFATTEDVADLSAGDYTVEVTDNATGCIATDTYGVDQPPQLNADFSAIANSCDTVYAATLTTLGGTPPFTYDWGTFSNSSTNTAPITLMDEQTNIAVTVTDDNGCLETASQVVTLLESPRLKTSSPVVLQLNIGMEQNIWLGEYYDNLDGFSYLLSMDESISSPNADTAFILQDMLNTEFVSGTQGVNFIGNASYIIYPVSSGGCTADPLVLNLEIFPADAVDYGLFIPEIFTPNGDGYNDVWQITATDGDYPIGSYQIFNRNGSLVADSDNLGEVWEGNDVPDGVYFVVVEVQGNQYKGAISKVSK